ncbi:MAG: hypothetical protein ACFFBV_09425 [Promethearchaeota archaeon]
MKYSFLLIILIGLFSQFISYGRSAPSGIFDGLYISHIHSLSTYPEEIPTNLSYTHVSGDIYHVEWAWGGSIGSTGSWDVNINTRIVSNVQVFGPPNGSHPAFWIHTNISLYDEIISSCALTSAGTFTISNNLVIPYGNISINIWEMTDPDNTKVWYEKSTGILLNGTFRKGTIHWESFEYVDTNAVFTEATIPSDGGTIPGYNYFLLISMFCLIGIIIIQYKSKKRKK